MKKKLIIPDEVILTKIYFVRGQKVMLDHDLSVLYGVETKYLKRQVKRNLHRFPGDFMFELNNKEFKNLRSQIGTSSWGGSRIASFAFTEQGVAMLSSVLNSKRAIEVNIRIIRLFTKMSKLLSTRKDVLLKLQQLEKKINKQDSDIQMVFEALKELLNPVQPERKRIGFKSKIEK